MKFLSKKINKIDEFSLLQNNFFEVLIFERKKKLKKEILDCLFFEIIYQFALFLERIYFYT